MESKRFDEIVASLGVAQSSRRSTVKRFGAVGLAGILAAVGIGGAEEAEAKKRGKKRRKRRRRGGGGGATAPAGTTSFNINFNPLGLGGPCNAGACGPGQQCNASNICESADTDAPCNSPSECDSGRCVGGFCATCPVTSICGVSDGSVCCVVGASCVDETALNGVCILT